MLGRGGAEHSTSCRAAPGEERRNTTIVGVHRCGGWSFEFPPLLPGRGLALKEEEGLLQDVQANAETAGLAARVTQNRTRMDSSSQPTACKRVSVVQRTYRASDPVWVEQRWQLLASGVSTGFGFLPVPLEPDLHPVSPNGSLRQKQGKGLTTVTSSRSRQRSGLVRQTKGRTGHLPRGSQRPRCYVRLEKDQELRCIRRHGFRGTLTARPCLLRCFVGLLGAFPSSKRRRKLKGANKFAKFQREPVREVSVHQQQMERPTQHSSSKVRRVDTHPADFRDHHAACVAALAKQPLVTCTYPSKAPNSPATRESNEGLRQYDVDCRKGVASLSRRQPFQFFLAGEPPPKCHSARKTSLEDSHPQAQSFGWKIRSVLGTFTVADTDHIRSRPSDQRKNSRGFRSRSLDRAEPSAHQRGCQPCPDVYRDVRCDSRARDRMVASGTEVCFGTGARGTASHSGVTETTKLLRLVRSTDSLTKTAPSCPRKQPAGCSEDKRAPQGHRPHLQWGQRGRLEYRVCRAPSDPSGELFTLDPDTKRGAGQRLYCGQDFDWRQSCVVRQPAVA